MLRRHIEDSLGEAFGKGLLIGFAVGGILGCALTVILGVASGAYR